MTRTAQVQQATARQQVLCAAVVEASRRLNLTTGEIAEIIGISQSSASRLTRGLFFLEDGTKTWETAALLIRLYRGLASIVGNSDELAQAWLDSPNRIFGERKPIEMIKRIDGLVHACEYVDAHRAPA